MLKLTPLRSEKVWGYEDWIASTHKDGVQKDFKELAGNYPLLVKIIQADDTLSVQVHPDDSTAETLEGKSEHGKTECWYVLDSKPGAKLVAGLKEKLTREQIKKAAEEKSLEQYLNFIEVKKGDFIFIPSGTVHAIGGGLRLLEVQQCCNITYRLYDWGRPREIHIEKGALSVKNLPDILEDVSADEKPFNFKTVKPLPQNFKCPYFSLSHKTISGGYSYLASGKECELLFVVKSTDLKAKGVKLCEEEIFAVTPGEKITLEGHGEIIRIRT